MNTRLKCLLLDDELPSLSYLKLLCSQIPEVEVIRVYNRPQDFLDEYLTLDFDLLITDIEMPDIKGIELVDYVRDKAVIFTTAHAEYAADAFDLQVIDYVRKPLDLNRLKQAINKVILWQSTEPAKKKNSIQINSDKGKYILQFDQVLFITTSALDSRDKVALLTNGTEITLKNISFHTLEQFLPAEDFCRINKKELIALSTVTAFSHDRVTTSLQMENGQFRTLILSEKFKTGFLQKISL